MEQYVTLQQIDQATEFVRCRTSHQPRVGMVLGSGLGELADLVENADIIPTADIPFWPESTVLGHEGRLVIGDLGGQKVLILQGRTHYYEGYSTGQIALPIRVMQRLGMEMVILTNAAGAVHPDYEPGDLMIISDHISLMMMAGPNPLRGPNIDELGERFPDMSQIYDRELRAQVKKLADDHNITVREGVYVGLAGPSFEGPADLRFLRAIGSDAVGMSTVPEAIAARHGGLRVLGISGISNKANLDGSTVTTHEEVLEAGKVLVPKLKTLLLELLRSL